ncbi:helix-turn-helix domain-containing protein [Lacinutrix iliipiscaria]|uniref:Helix-turn-helix domain-containing protein n=1 Tax=Lacinutrix iliipiscaria TaxID=1230532 RepID=A0ABW5WJC2_9FLAO
MKTAFEFIKSLNYFYSGMSSDIDEEEVLWYLARKIIMTLNFVDCVIYKYEKENNMLVQSAAFGTKNPYDDIIFNRIDIPVGSGVVGQVAETLIPEIVYDTTTDLRYIVDDKQRFSEICVPITIHGKLYGIIDCEHPDKEFFNQLHLQLLLLIASLSSQKIKEVRKNSKVSNLDNKLKYFEDLEGIMKQKKLYRDEQLTSLKLADELDISSGYLSKIVNEISGKPIIDYINEYRVNEIKEHIISEDFKNYTLLSIGLEAGFNSKASFYRNFKKLTDMSPSEYHKNSKKLYTFK